MRSFLLWREHLINSILRCGCRFGWVVGESVCLTHTYTGLPVVVLLAFVSTQSAGRDVHTYIHT